MTTHSICSATGAPGPNGFHSFAFVPDRMFGTPTLPGAVPEIVTDEDGEWYGVSNQASVLHFAGKSDRTERHAEHHRGGRLR